MAIEAAIVALVACVFLPAQGWAQTHLSGTVRDSEGAVISEAHIFVHWDPSGSEVGLTTNVGIKQDLTLTSNNNGSFVSLIVVEELPGPRVSAPR